MNNTADILLDEGTGNDQYGYSVSSTGDVNADGYGDLIIGASTLTQRRCIYLFRWRDHRKQSGCFHLRGSEL
ncbi:MAG: FG-GAP repeat protein [Ignavibacteria bacterium]|nr:FG-GAP repeat protein [Ignavibacteria bacterium]